MSDQSTPLRRRLEPQDGGSAHVYERGHISPQVEFHSPMKDFGAPRDDTRRHGKLKKIKEDVALKIADRRLLKASPSRLCAQSMLSFDLERYGSDEVLGGDDELFVKFVTDRRRSSGRGTLRTLINKRINLQVGATALAQRRAEKVSVKAEVETVTLPRIEELPEKPKRKKKKKKEVIPAPSSRESILEIPLGQEDSGSEQSTISQTQVFGRDEEIFISQTQVLSRSEPPTPLAFMPTPRVERLETVEEEPERRVRKVFRNPFVDDEAEQSEDGGEIGSSDESSGSDADLSDLIASSGSEIADDDPFAHAKLHREWLEDQENRELVEGGKESKEVGASERARRRALALAKLETSKKECVKKKEKLKGEKSERKKIIEIAPTRVPVGKISHRPRKFNNRKSSVSSSCTDLDIRVISALPKSGGFSFLLAPAENVLASVSEKMTAKMDAESRNATGSRLMGSKRFVFGAN